MLNTNFQAAKPSSSGEEVGKVYFTANLGPHGIGPF